MVAISGVTTLPLVLLTARPNIKTISDIKPGERIAVPLLAAPQMRYLRMQADQWFTMGLWSRLQQQVVVMPHQDALDALTEGKGDVAAYFSSPPFTQVALKDPKIRPILSSVDALGGKSSFFVIASPRETLAAQPKLAEVVAEAIDEACRHHRQGSETGGADLAEIRTLAHPRCARGGGDPARPQGRIRQRRLWRQRDRRPDEPRGQAEKRGLELEGCGRTRHRRRSGVLTRMPAIDAERLGEFVAQIFVKLGSSRARGRAHRTLSGQRQSRRP